MHGETPENAKSSPLLISICKIPEDAAADAGKFEVSHFLKPEQNVALIQKTDKVILWKRYFHFRHSEWSCKEPWALKQRKL